MKTPKRNFNRSWLIKRQISKTKCLRLAKVNTTWLFQSCFHSRSILARRSRFKSGSRLKKKSNLLKRTTILAFVPHLLHCPGVTAKIWICTRKSKTSVRDLDKRVRRQVWPKTRLCQSHLASTIKTSKKLVINFSFVTTSTTPSWINSERGMCPGESWFQGSKWWSKGTSTNVSSESRGWPRRVSRCQSCHHACKLQRKLEKKKTRDPRQASSSSISDLPGRGLSRTSLVFRRNS